MLIPQPEEPIPIPAYLLYLLFLILGHYFAARGHSRGQPDAWNRQPLNLPRGCIRLLLLASLTGDLHFTATARTRRVFRGSMAGFGEIVARSAATAGRCADGFFCRGTLTDDHQASSRRRGFRIWRRGLSLIAVLLLMATATLIHLVIQPSLKDSLSLPIWEGILSAVVAFYFGERS